MTNKTDIVEIKDIEVECIVGIYCHEREKKQPLCIDLKLAMDLQNAAMNEDLKASIDYFLITEQIRFILERCKFQLLETAAMALAHYLLAPPALGEKRAQIEKATITLTKPKAMEKLGIPSIQIERHKNQIFIEQEKKKFGIVDVIFETQNAGIYRLNVAPKNQIPLHVHQVMHESEMILTHGIKCQGKAEPVGTTHDWPHNHPHLYDNPTEHYQSILCVDSPPFMPEDEIEVTGK